MGIRYSVFGNGEWKMGHGSWLKWRMDFSKPENEPHERPPRIKALNFGEFGEREPFPNFQTEKHTARKLHYNGCSTPWGQESLMIILQQFIPEEFF